MDRAMIQPSSVLLCYVCQCIYVNAELATKQHVETEINLDTPLREVICYRYISANRNKQKQCFSGPPYYIVTFLKGKPLYTYY